MNFSVFKCHILLLLCVMRIKILTLNRTGKNAQKKKIKKRSHDGKMDT